MLLHQGKIVAQGTPGELRSRIGGDVVVLEAGDTASLARGHRAAFRSAALGDGRPGARRDRNGHRFIAEVVEAFPGAIDSVGLHKPTLEDVFVRETGASIE